MFYSGERVLSSSSIEKFSAMLDTALFRLMRSYRDQDGIPCHVVRILLRNNERTGFLRSHKVYIEIREIRDRSGAGTFLNYYNITPEHEIGYTIWNHIVENIPDKTEDFICNTLYRIRKAQDRMKIARNTGSYIVYYNQAANLA